MTVLSALALLLLLIWKLPVWEVRYLRGIPESAHRFPLLVDQYRSTWAKIAGGIAVLAGVWFAWLRLNIQEEGQVTERFSRAVEQLGDPQLSVRIGGIYALERIAKDSEKDHQRAVEVLTAFLRDPPPRRGRSGKSESNLDSEEDSTDGMDVPREAPTPLKRRGRRHRRGDIQAALTVLGRREISHERGREVRLDLGGADLRTAYLKGANLAGAVLHDADLRGADLREANLTKVTNFKEADLTGAIANSADLEKAWLMKANLSGADLRRSNLENATLLGSQLHKIQLAGASLNTANLAAADMRGAKLNYADLQRTLLVGANLQGADFEGAELAGAKLDQADLRNVENLTREQLNSAASFEDTELPKDLNQTS